MEFIVSKKTVDYKKKMYQEQQKRIKEQEERTNNAIKEDNKRKNEYMKNEYPIAVEQYNISQEEQINEELFKCKNPLIEYYAEKGTIRGFKCEIEQITYLENEEAKKWMKNRFPSLELKKCGGWSHFWNLKDPDDTSTHSGSRCTWETTDKTFSLTVKNN